MWKHDTSDSTLVSYKICKKTHLSHGNSGHVRGQVSIHLMHFAIWLPSPRYDLKFFSFEWGGKGKDRYYLLRPHPFSNPVPALVSEPDPQNVEKEGLVNGPGVFFFGSTFNLVSAQSATVHESQSSLMNALPTGKKPSWADFFQKRSTLITNLQTAGMYPFHMHESYNACH